MLSSKRFLRILSSSIPTTYRYAVCRAKALYSILRYLMSPICAFIDSLRIEEELDLDEVLHQISDFPQFPCPDSYTLVPLPLQVGIFREPLHRPVQLLYPLHILPHLTQEAASWIIKPPTLLLLASITQSGMLIGDFSVASPPVDTGRLGVRNKVQHLSCGKKINQVGPAGSVRLLCQLGLSRLRRWLTEGGAYTLNGRPGVILSKGSRTIPKQNTSLICH